MRHPWLLLFVFIVSLLCWSLYYLPASVVVGQLSSRVQAMQLPVSLNQAAGTAWQGSAKWHWRGQQGRLNWQVDWHGTTPGLRLAVNGSDLKLSGWIGGWSQQQLVARHIKLMLPLPLLLQGQRQLQAEGRLSGQIARLRLNDGMPVALEGKLFYSGGSGRWRRQTALVPAMHARLYMQQNEAHLAVTDDRQQPLAAAYIDTEGVGHLQVYRAYAEAVGMSQGEGSSEDVVLSLSRPLITAQASR